MSNVQAGHRTRSLKDDERMAFGAGLPVRHSAPARGPDDHDDDTVRSVGASGRVISGVTVGTGATAARGPTRRTRPRRPPRGGGVKPGRPPVWIVGGEGPAAPGRRVFT